MKKAILALLLAGALLLTGCSAMLDRPYAAVSPHPEHPGTGEDDSTITVSSYPELVNAVLHFVSQTMEEGHILLPDYDGDVVTDLNTACVEVAKDDPLGAYAVDFIQTEYTRVLTTYEATVSITYRRTPEQVRSLVNVTGSSAIRRVLENALAEFKPQVALRVGYFAEDEAYIRALVRQAYCDTPAAALGMPEVTVSLYPEQGSQRVVEILLQYGQPRDVLLERRTQVMAAAERLTAPLQELPLGSEQLLSRLLALLPGQLTYTDQLLSDGSSPNTTWDALVGGGGDDEGVALAFRLLCDRLELDCAVTEGTLNGAPHIWNTLVVDDGTPLHVDLSRGDAPRTFTDEELTALGYAWGEG